MMNRKVREFGLLGLSVLLSGAMSPLHAESEKTLVVTSSNAAANQLLVYSTSGNLLQTIAT